MFSPSRTLAALSVLSIAAPAYAGGFEIPAPGTRALGRGGAFHVRADDATALQYNPARLADLTRLELQGNFASVFLDACFARQGSYGDNLSPTDVSRFGTRDDFGAEAFPEVCRGGGPQLVPNAIFALPVIPGVLGVGLGVLTPLANGAGEWEGDDHAVTGASGARRPSPVRYLFARPRSRFFHLGLGAGYRPTPWLSVGTTLHWGFASTESVTYSVLVPGEDPSFDVRSTAKGSDAFVPGITLAVHMTPTPWLEVAVGGRYFDTPRLDASTQLVFGDFAAEPAVPGGTIPTVTVIDDVTLTSPQPPRLWVGARYVARDPELPLSAGTVEEPDRERLSRASRERWDLELNVVYEHNSAVDAQRADLPDGATLMTRSLDANGQPLATMASISDRVYPKRWRDQVTLHLGSDVRLLPERLWVRAGTSFESNGVDERFLNVDFFPGTRLGLHPGATLRVESLDISIAYAHLFQFRLTNDAPGSGSAKEASYTQPVSLGTGRVVNHGSLEAAWNTLSVGVALRL